MSDPSRHLRTETLEQISKVWPAVEAHMREHYPHLDPIIKAFRIGPGRDGKIEALHFKTLLDGGGYGSYGVASTYYTGALQTVTYDVERYKFQGARAS